MAEPTIADVYERLGGLRSDVGGLRDDMAEARHDRQRIADDVTALTVRTAKLEAKLEKLEPQVETVSSAFSNARNKVIGGVAVIVFIFGFVGWVVGLFLTELKTWLIRSISG